MIINYYTTTIIYFWKNVFIFHFKVAFLSNIQNKSRFVKMSSTYLKNNGYTIMQAADDADNDYYKRGDFLSTRLVWCYCRYRRYIDLLVLLIVLTTEENYIKFFKPEKRNNGKHI